MRALVDQCLRRRLLILASLAIATMRFVGAPVDAYAQAQTGIVVGRVTDARIGRRGRGSESAGRRHAPRRGHRSGRPVSHRRRADRHANDRRAAARLFVESAGGHVAAGATVTHEVGLAPSAVSLDQIVVTGTAGDAERRSIGNAVSTIDASTEMAKASPPDIANLLRSRARRASTFSRSAAVSAPDRRSRSADRAASA